MCHQFTLLLGHLWNDHLNSSVSTKLASTHLTKCPPSLDVNPSRRHLPRIRLPVRAFPARHCQKSPIAPYHLGRRNTLVNIRLVANVPLTLHTDAQLSNSLLTSIPLCHCRLPFRRACHGAHELVSHKAHELFNPCLRNRLRHQVCRIHARVNHLRGEPIQRFCMSTCFAFPSPLRLTRHIVAEASRCRFSLYIDQAHRCRGIQVQIQPKSFATLWIPSPSDAVLTAAHSSLSADDNATTCCFLVHTLRQ